MRFCVVAAVCLLLRLSVQGQDQAPQKHLFLPLLQASDAADLGIAFSNPTLNAATITLNARGYDGKVIAGTEIRNPATITLPGLAQRALRPVEIFGAGIGGRTGWVDVSISNSAVKGFFLLFDANLQSIDGARFSERPSSRLTFPKATPDTTLSFANTGSDPIEPTISFFDNNGTPIGKKRLSIPAHGGFSGSVGQMVPNAGTFSGFAVLEPTPFTASLDVVAGLETYRRRSDGAALTGVSDAELLRSGYIAQLLSQGGYSSEIGLTNPSLFPQRVRITADALDVAGQTRDAVSVERTIAPFSRIAETASQMFGFSGNTLITGYVRFEVLDDGPGVVGYAEYSTVDGTLLSAVAAEGAGLSEMYFSQIAQGGGFYTGLALLNPNAQASSVTVDAFTTDGKRIASTTQRLEPNTRRTRLLNEFFPAITNQSGGYIRITASRAIFAYELFGTTAGSPVLANVPPQGSLVRPQSGGRTVIASKGAEVLSSDGATSALISPGALPSDTAIRVESLAVADMPAPSGSRRVIAAVEATPGDTRFSIPVQLTFPIATQLAPDTALPLLLFNPDSKQYSDTEFTAIVDETGRNASAEVTHFSIYAAALPDSQILTVNSASPSSGLPGATVVISGNGFSAIPAENLVTFTGPDNSSVTASVTAATTTQITTVVPSGAVTGYIVVRRGSRSSIGVLFTVPQDQPRPTISSLSPTKALFSGSTVDVEIAGTGFRATSTVSYDGGNISATFVDSTLLLISIDTSQQKPGIHKVVVTNPSPGGGASNTAEFSILYPRPLITAITPNPRDLYDTGEITLTGSGFTTDSIVTIDGIPVIPKSVTASVIKLPSRSLTASTHDVLVTNPAPGGGESNKYSLLVKAPVQPEQILLVDASTGGAVSEIVVNEGASVRAGFVVIDSAGDLSSNSELNFSSLDSSVATIDSGGTILGKHAGFSTLIVNAGTAVSVFTITVVQVNAGSPGFTVTGVAQDFAGRLYLAATQDNTVRLAQDLSQSPTVYAGVPQTPGLKNDVRLQSWFSKPAFIALNQADGRLYVSDGANNVIRRVGPGSGGVVETLAGTGAAGGTDGSAASATFRNPQGVALDNRGYLWIADSGNNTVRRIHLPSGRVETVAGVAGETGNADGHGGSARFSAPAGLAVETETPAQSLARERRGDPPPPVHVIVADSGNGAIRRVSETGDVETIQFTSSALTSAITDGSSKKKGAAQFSSTAFSSPTGVAVDPLGNIYVTEANSGAVKTILNNGKVVAAVQPNTFTNPQGIAITETGRVIVAASNRDVQEIRYGAPQIAVVAPLRVSNRGGEQVVITGSNFAPDTVVLIGGVVATSVIVENTKTIRLIAPAAPSGQTTLTVQNRGGIAQTAMLVDPTPPNALQVGAITTIAGGSTFAGDGGRANLASIAPPWGIAVDSFGNILVAETARHRIRRISATTNIITTIAGSGQSGFSGDGTLALSASLTNPVGVAVDVAGNIFIADTDNDRVRKLDASTGIISTIAGNGLKGFAGENVLGTSASLWTPQGIAVDSSGNVYVADTSNSRIRKIAAGTGIITTVAGNGGHTFSGDNGLATSAALNFPYGVAVDAAGNIYIADTFNFRIRKVDATTGIITTVAGNGLLGSFGDGGTATAAALSYSFGLSVDSSGNIFIMDSLNERIRRVDGISHIISTVAGNGTRGFSGDGGPATSANFADPAALALDAAGNILVVDTFNFRARRITPGGVISTIAGNGQQLFSGDNGPATAAALTLPAGIAVDGSNNLFIADTFLQQVRKVSAATGVITSIAGNGQKSFSGDNGPATVAGLANPAGVGVDAAGNTFIVDTANNRVRVVATASQVITTFAGNGQTGFSGEGSQATSAALNSPGGMAIDGAGNVFIADTLNHRIRKVATGTGVITTVAGNGVQGFSGDNGSATSAMLAKPSSVAVDAAGNLYIADTANSRIRKVESATGIITTVAGSSTFGFSGDNGAATSAALAQPSAVAIDKSGNLLIADTFNNRIRRVNLSTGIITTVAGNGQATFSGDNDAAILAALNNPRGVAVDSAGNIIIADWFNGRIRLVRGP